MRKTPNFPTEASLGSITGKPVIQASSEAIDGLGELRPGDRVATPNLGAGTLQAPLWLMPHHHLIRFDDGRLLWVLRSTVDREVVTVPAGPKRQRRSKMPKVG